MSGERAGPEFVVGRIDACGEDFQQYFAGTGRRPFDRTVIKDLGAAITRKPHCFHRFHHRLLSDLPPNV